MDYPFRRRVKDTLALDTRKTQTIRHRRGFASFVSPLHQDVT